MLLAGPGVAGLAFGLSVGGFFRSLQFTASNTLAYADIDRRRMSRATAMASVGRVAVGAFAVETMLWNATTTITHGGGLRAGLSSWCR